MLNLHESNESARVRYKLYNLVGFQITCEHPRHSSSCALQLRKIARTNKMPDPKDANMSKNYVIRDLWRGQNTINVRELVALNLNQFLFSFIFNNHVLCSPSESDAKSATTLQASGGAKKITVTVLLSPRKFLPPFCYAFRTNEQADRNE